MTPEPAAPPQGDNPSTTHMVHVLMQFAVAVRHRWGVLAAAMVVAGLLGGLYYATATRYYGARASLLILQSGADLTQTSMTAEGGKPQGLMPTYEKLITSARVLEGAVAYLPRREDRIDMLDVPRNKWAAVLREHVSAKTVRGTNLIDIEYRSKDPGAAVTVVNAVVSSYLQFMDETHKGTATEIKRILAKEQALAADRLDQKQQELVEARKRAGELGSRETPGVTHPVLQKATKVNEALIETQNELAMLRASLASVEAAYRRGEDLQQYLDSVAAVVSKEMLLSALGFNTRDAATQAALEREWLDARTELKSMEEYFGPAHPRYKLKAEKVRELEHYLTGYQERVNDRLTHIRHNELGPMLINMLRQKVNELSEQELSLGIQYEKARAEATELIGSMAEIEILEHDVEWLRKLHVVLLDRIESVDLKDDAPDVRAQLVTPPVRAQQPVSPNLRRVGLMSLLAGLALGLLAVYVLDILDDRFRSVEELEAQMGVPALAMVRQLKTDPAGGLESLQICREPDAAESEAFRTLRTALSLSNHPAHRLVITSAEPGDGKTTVLANLAVSYAQSEQRTLLVDADLRRPGLTAMLGYKGAEGLSGIIRGKQDVAEMAAEHIRASGVEGLDVLPSGPRPSNPAELLTNPRFAELLAWAETVYDRVLVDSPPSLAASDSAVIGRMLDGVVMVIQPDKNRRRLVLRAAESMTAMGVTLLGVVINRVGGDRDRGYYGYAGGYDYHGYGGDEDAAGPDMTRLDEPTAEEPVIPVPHFAPTRVEGAPAPRAGIVPRRVV